MPPFAREAFLYIDWFLSKPLVYILDDPSRCGIVVSSRPPSEVVAEHVEGVVLSSLFSSPYVSVPSKYEGKGCFGTCHHTQLRTRSGHLPVCVHRHDHHRQEVGVGREKWGKETVLWSHPPMLMHCGPTVYYVTAGISVTVDLASILMGARLSRTTDRIIGRRAKD